MNTRYDEPSLRISIPIADREHIFRGGTTPRSHARFGRQKGVRRGGAAARRIASPLRTTGCLKKPASTPLRACSPWAIGTCARTVLPPKRMQRLISFSRLRQGRKLHGAFGPVGGMTSAMGCTEFSVGTLQKSGLSDRRTVIGAPLKLLSADLISP